MDRARSLIGMNLILFGPTWIIALLMAIVSVALLFSVVLPALSVTTGVNPQALFAPFFGLLCVFGAAVCGLAIYGLFANILRVFGERAIVLENQGAIAGLRRGWRVFRARLGDGLVTGIINWFIGVAIGVVIGLVLLGGFVALAVGMIGAGALSSGRILDQLGPAVLLPLLCVGGIIWLVMALISAVLVAFSSTNWTLAYKQMASQVPATA